MSISKDILGLPTASAVSVLSKRYVTAALRSKGQKTTSSNGIETRVAEWENETSSDYETKITITHRFDSKANKGRGATRVTLQIDTWEVTTNDDDLVLEANPVSAGTFWQYVGKKTTSKAEILDLVMGITGIAFTLSTATPEADQIGWLSGGSLNFFAE